MTAMEAAERSFWDAAFRFSSVLPDFQLRMAQQAARSLAYRQAFGPPAHRAYGPHPRQFLRSYPGRGERGAGEACVFVHGGYWRALSVDEHDFVGQALAPELDFHSVEYRLQPEIGFEAQVGDVLAGLQAALDLCAERRIGRVRLVGHSAGAHLAMSALQRLALPCAVTQVCLVSGIYDLAPVSRSFLADEIRFCAADIARYSPLRHAGTFADLRYHLAVGSRETAEYRRQAFELTRLLRDRGRTAECTVIDGADHLDAVTGFLDTA